MLFSSKTLLPVLALASSVSAQTFSECNPLTNPGACPPNPALGKSATIQLNSPSDSFTEHGSINYGSDGAQFTVAKSGDNPTLASKWYIMFGHVEFVIKAAPGQGIVSSAVLMSDCLDEIDWEWLGGDDNQVQSNYFRKGQTVTGYNRGAFHDSPGTHDNFHTYAIDWTADQIVWSIDGTTVRVLEANNAENGDYPQTPMQIKIGSWAGGDSGNPQGTIDWAGGLTDYSAGPFSMYLRSIAVTDYSTGSSYTYSGTEGTWQSIQSDGGNVNPQGNGRPASAENPPAVTSTVPNDSSAPLAFDPHDSGSVYATRTGWPWDGTATASIVPSGWSVDGNGNAHPPSSGAVSAVPVYVLTTALISGLLFRVWP
ncbi:uncharacterized protein HMPREF1541_06166 [Cyphellophora europaea CBS 101466]|uniref:GH16 domain-containing protein n=1 Tax=Cyphellophora europaea (strain CBS 101466) TaxID=1220924 RepID=W2RW81_CYPE1|nr:uncharacterized protein HMPREF1541_06166 [Cyphellophora europaea CBS 101466]ETN39939.1 hypothetical protein HMPREF1541_06166 [Cyphellophora europaea CBS 101466]